MIGRRKAADQQLLLTWPAAEHADGYRVLLRDSSTDKLALKLECSRPDYRLDLRQLHVDHYYEWAVQKRADRFDEWQYHLPYMHLFRPSDPPSPTTLEWEPTGADVYRVLLNDRRLDLAVIKDALIGTRYPVDWRRLIVEHEHDYAIQALIPGPAEAWETVHEYRALPAAPEEVRVIETREPGAGPHEPGVRPLLFLWTCDTEVNLRRMDDPRPELGVEAQVFGRDGDREYGINFMMELLEEFNFRGTFFVDILMEHQFGRAELERTVEAIVSRGHDVQLHLHPSPHLLFAADPRLERFAPGLTADDRDLFRGALELAVDLFVARVGYQPVAYRSGAYHICDDYLSVLPEFDIAIDSSMYAFKNCRVSEWARTRTEPFWIGDVLEVPVSWMLRRSGSPERREFEHEQLSPTGSGIQQDAFAQYRPPGPIDVPATLVYLAHSFSFLSVERRYDAKRIEAWNAQYREQVPAEIFERVRMGTDNEWISMHLPPDTDRIAVMTRLLHGLAARTDVRPQTFRELHEGGLERFHAARELPVDMAPVWDGASASAAAAPMQVYSQGLLERMRQDGRRP